MGIEAIAAVATAIGTGTAVAGGIATVATAAAWIGTYVTLAGVVTGSKDLMKIGGVIGLAGGVAGLAAGAAGAGTAAVAEGAGSAVAGEATAGAVGEAATSAATEGITNAATQSATELAGQELTSQAAGQSASLTGGDLSMQGVANEAITQPVQQATTGAAQSANAIATPGPSAATDASLSNATSSMDAKTASLGVEAPSSPADVSITGQSTQSVTGGDLSLQGQAGVKDSNSFFKSFGDFFKSSDNKNLLGGALQGMSKMYESDRNYDINKQLLALKQQQAANGSAIPTLKYNGIIARAQA